MNRGNHSVNELFEQLGLPSETGKIEKFIAQHKLRMGDGELYRAIFWNPSQAQFLKESVEEDADWAEAVDELDARLRH